MDNGNTPPAVDQKRGENLAVFSDAMNTIRWLLNHAAYSPKKHIGGLMECFTVKDNHTTKCSEQLESLWELRETIRAALSHQSIPPGHALVPIEEWQGMNTLPMDGTEFYARVETPMRYKLYKPNSNEAKSGIKGRWQEMNQYGGWDNTDVVPVEWRPHYTAPKQEKSE